MSAGRAVDTDTRRRVRGLNGESARALPRLLVGLARGASFPSGFPAGILFNTGAGQHILKNPLVVNSIIEKVRAPGRCPCARGAAEQSGACAEPEQFYPPEVFISQRLSSAFPPGRR